jgi:hypothetical protein
LLVAFRSFSTIPLTAQPNLSPTTRSNVKVAVSLLSEAQAAGPSVSIDTATAPFAQSLTPISATSSLSSLASLSFHDRSFSLDKPLPPSPLALSVSAPLPASLPAPAPAPVSHHMYLTDSDSDSPSEDATPPRFNMSASSGTACVEQSNNKSPPTLTAGTVTPEVLHAWERGCFNYFRHKIVLPADQVFMVLFELKDLRMDAWAHANTTHLESLLFPAFMTELCDEFLEVGWERLLKLRIISARQGAKLFGVWLVELQNQNTLLYGRPAHLSDINPREQLEANMDSLLALKCEDNDTQSVADFRSWCSVVDKIDKSLARERKATNALVEDAINRDRKTRGRTTYAAPGTPSSTTPASGGSRSYAPKLMDAECVLLSENGGCFKCRCFHVDHRTYACPNGSPAATGYKTLTAADIGKPKPKTRVIAHVGPASSVDETCVMEALSVLGVGEEDSEYVTAPLHSPHLQWDCLLDSPNSPAPTRITALIDHGSHAVLIDEALVDCLGLRRRPLPRVEVNKLAMGQAEVVFSEWVKLRVYSPDNSWSSR